MKLPKGLLLTAWMMVGFVIAGWLRMYYRPPRTHLAHHPFTHVFVIATLLALNFVEFACIFHYAKGRNWARLTVIVFSVVSILGLLRLKQEDIPGRIIVAGQGLLGVFFLYWLNTRSVREFFKRNTATAGRS